MKWLQRFLEHGDREYTHKKLGLERIREVLSFLDHPENYYKSILIAGTNGKGSVATLVESILIQAGYTVGLYRSPHVFRFTERMRIHGEEVTTEELEDCLEAWARRGLLNESGELIIPSGGTLTWFEKVTVLALEIFRRRQVELAVLEVGLGGRLDATNAVDPQVSAITSIGLDHTEVLGNSLFEIAQEKLGVARAGKPLVLGPMTLELRTFLQAASRMMGAHPVSPDFPQGTTEYFSYGPFSGLRLGLRGDFQLKNVATVIEIISALKEQGWSIDNQALREGLARAQLPGRLDVLSGPPPQVFSGAHNVQALEELVESLRKMNLPKRPVLLVGMMGEKDARAALQVLQKLSPKQWLFTQVKSSRSLPLEKWRALAEFFRLPAEFFENSAEAMIRAQQLTDADSYILVTGSLYLVGELGPR